MKYLPDAAIGMLTTNAAGFMIYRLKTAVGNKQRAVSLTYDTLTIFADYVFEVFGEFAHLLRF